MTAIDDTAPEQLRPYDEADALGDPNDPAEYDCWIGVTLYFDPERVGKQA